jgi:hypothetical protein
MRKKMKKKIGKKKTGPQNNGMKHSKPLVKLIRKSSAKVDKFSDVIVVALESVSPVSLGRPKSDMKWKKDHK